MGLRNFFGRFRRKKPETKPGAQKPNLEETAKERGAKARQEWVRERTKKIFNGEMPELGGAYRGYFLSLPVSSNSFKQACAATKKKPDDAFAEMLEKFEGRSEQDALSKRWTNARNFFIGELQRLLKEIAQSKTQTGELKPEKILQLERRTLEGIFARIIEIEMKKKQ